MPAYTGTSAADTLNGSTGADTLTGLAGNDTYLVNSLSDVVVEASGGGTDTVRAAVLDALKTFSIEAWTYVENLAWTLTTAAILKGNAAANQITGNAGADTLYGAAGNDTLLGAAGNDSLVGGTGHDSLDGGTGTDMMVGGTGDDRYVIDSSADRAFEYASAGFDTIVSSVAKDLRVSWAQFIEGLLYTGTAAATLHGNAGNNRVESRGTAGDVLYGYDGHDTLDGGAGTAIDTLNGGDGNDVYVVDAGDVVNEALDEGIDTLVGAKLSLGGSYATTVENLFYTGATGKSVIGNALANVVSGGTGNDTVNGSTGNDTVLGGLGTDTVLGGTGNDLLYGGANPDVFWIVDRRLVADGNADRLEGGTGSDRYLIDSLADTVIEAAGTAGGTLDVVVSAIDMSLTRYATNAIEALVLQKGSGAWRAEGTADRGDILVGNERDNLLVGSGGDDTIASNADVSNLANPQSDVIDGGTGDDVLVAFDFGASATGTREVTFFGGTGNDLYLIGARFDSVGGQDSGGSDVALLLGSASLQALEGVETIVLYGADAELDIAARAALRQVYAAANGATSIYRGSFGTASDATGNDLANTIIGNNLNNGLAGGAGNDTIVGGKGADTLDGGTGNDELDGGLGNDWVVIDSAGDVAVEEADAGFDVLVSSIVTSLPLWANFEGLQYTGSTAVQMHNGIGNLTAEFLGGGRGNDTIDGFGGNDTLDGGRGADDIAGGDGNDVLRGAAGNDTVLGGLGDDTLEGGDGNDGLDGGGNWDVLAGDAGDDTLYGGDGRDTLDGGTGDDALLGENNDDTLVGGEGSDQISGGGAAAEGRTSSFGDHLWGDAQFGTGGGEADLFAFDTLTADNLVRETFTGSGAFGWTGGATIGDFEQTIDAIAIAAGFVGNGDAVIDSYTETQEPGETWAAGAELVFVRADVDELFAFSRTSFFDDISAESVAAVLGDADAIFGIDDRRLFVLDDGTNSAVFLFQSVDENATVTIDELYLVAVVTGTDALQPTDFVLF
jgi:Ca2+-binding RTX toxin-like protein